MIMHPAIKLRHIRVFLAIAAEGNLSAVARAQGVTQPALSRSLAELEDLLAAPLFRREKRRLILTEQGALFRHHAAAAVQALETAAAVLHPEGPGGRIRVGILPTAATRLFPVIALRFRQIAPQVTLAVETGPHSHLVRLLRDGAIDLMIGRMPAARDMAGLRFEHLYEDPIALVSRAGHPLAGQPVAQALAACPLILPPGDAIIRRAVDEYLLVLNRATPQPAFETVALAVGRGILAGSDALWFISRGVVADELQRGTLIEWPTGAAFLSGAVGLTWRQSGGQAGPEKTGLDLIRRLAQEEAAHMA
ncbi:LysR family transcriptional regulator, pca operon transcriptional activator [Paracoccus aminovorans]|uniref:LysR family transcriptional regulator, pca operon transcriptional activator n=1 Tax=Paracoccus aminovorans TaxID=34004 RepID=A0A1I3AQ87_9RHOB|nr:LysR substrate-binding domain-containing protein [Paracoccus aminovorans]CQR84330.1 pca operon transcriptional activator PcaQ [Paracoccus aminovorans]SFH52338.1 LysR family transcriptional regulator, pca operon transcriptional activator [Paracoccus aminovorans]